MRSQEYKKLMDRIEISGECRDKILDAAMEQQTNGTNSEGMYEEHMPVEVITRTPWYRTKAFAAAASVVVIAGMAGTGLAMTGNLGIGGPGAEIEVTEENVDTAADEDAEYECIYEGEVTLTNGEEGDENVASAVFDDGGDEEYNSNVITITNVSPTKVTLSVFDEDGSEASHLGNFHVEQDVNGEWIPVEPLETGFELDAFTFEENILKGVTWTFNFDCLENGRHRIAYDDFSEDEPKTVYDEFSIDYSKIIQNIRDTLDEYNRENGTDHHMLTDEEVGEWCSKVDFITREEYYKTLMRHCGSMEHDELMELFADFDNPEPKKWFEFEDGMNLPYFYSGDSFDGEPVEVAIDTNGSLVKPLGN